MKILIVGMRRSGTTILYDIMQNDVRLKSYYEPFCSDKINIGGGSNATDIAYGEILSDARKEFITERGLNLEENFFNVGAPWNHKEEFRSYIHDIYLDYIKYLLSKSDNVLLKFVRLNNKLLSITERVKGLKVIYIRKKPERFAESHIRGSLERSRNMRDRIIAKFLSLIFFRLKRGFNRWSSDNFSAFIYPKDRGKVPAYIRMIKLWKYYNDMYMENISKMKNSNSMVIEYEELSMQPENILKSIYNFIGMKIEPEIVEWAVNNVRPAKNIIRFKSKLWKSGRKEAGLDLV